ncbi:MAG: right-handed parallel beta-helix repeat-containing protein [Propionibacteriaceae bacterium]
MSASRPESCDPTAARPASSWVRRRRMASIGGVVLGMSTIGLGMGAALPAQAAPTEVTYYVDAAHGSDASSGRTPSQAWKSLAKVNATNFAPGSTVRLHRAQTWHGELKIAESGTPTRPVQVRAYGGGARPIITGGSSCVSVSGSYVTISYVHAKGCDWAGFEVSGDHVTLTSVSASGSVAGVSVTKKSTDARVLSSNIYNNTKMSVLTKSPAWDDSGAFGVVLNGTRTEIGYNTITGHEAFSYDFGTDGSAVEIYESSDNLIHHNLIEQSSGFELGGKTSRGNVFAFNQLYSTKATSEGFVTRGGGDQFGPVKDTLFANNSFYLTGARSKGLICYAGCNSAILTARNNIVVARGSTVWTDGAMKEDHNLFWGGSVQLKSGLGTGSKVADPRYVNVAKGDLHISRQGPAYRKGVALNVPTSVPRLADLTGRRPSIGVYQP